jgi:Rieske Fe-S protein
MQRKSTADVENDVQSSVPPATPASGEPAGNTRRGLLMGVGIVGVAGVVAACGGSDDGGGGSGGDGGSDGSGGGGAAVDAALAKVSDIPVGGGKIFPDQKLVVTQPQQGTIKAFSATCTHRGCTVGSVSGGTINCPCHGSKFKIDDASVAAGPASEPLEAKQVTVEGDEIKLA